ncbi:T9SS type A sorting domain-containing protein [Hymenobacter sp. M29]|uniref:T9SS type A sorting domain-containing protein n=2 Tax=Hymenobacter mellowenesis TaxID=3063995 RepID=A0ABT9A945_9BACT|nr:T9SS type A sorting domain-containing protein [Hymenobacter sp. M29]
MQTLTFTQKLLRQRRFLSFLLPLFAIFVGLGSTQTVQAAVTLGSAQVIVNQGNGNNTYAKATYDGSTLIDQKPGSTTAPKFDINTGTLIFNGGTLTTTETGTSVVNGAFIDYTIYDPSFNPVSSGTVQLAQTTASGGVRTFSNSTAATSIIPLIQTAGDGYSLSVSYRATYRNGSGPVLTTRDDNGGAGYTAFFDVTGTRAPAPTLNPANIQIASDGGNATSYYFPNTGTNPQFPGYNFCSSQNAGGTSCAFDINNGQLRLTNTTVTTTEAGSNTVSGVVLYYRVRSTSSGGGAFQPITLSQSGTASGGVRTFIIDPSSPSNSNPQPNLIGASAVTSIGNYAIDIYYQASGVNSSTGVPFTVTYPPTGYSTATFTVGGTPIAVTIWTGAVNDNWFDAGNWTNGIPNPSTNALIRDLGTGNSVPYPNIRSDFRYETAGGALIYDNRGSGPAQTLNFVMGGNSQAARSIARLVVGQLRVFGTFDNTYDSFIQRENTIMEFAGGNQNITGGSFVRVDISGGGTKTLQGVMNVSEALNFMTPNVYTTAANPLANNPYVTLSNNAGILATDITQPATNVVFLSDRASTNFNNGAQLNGENDPSFLYGFVRTTRQGVLVGETRTYGNIGMTLTFTGNNSPGNVEVTRNTVEAYSPVSGRFGIRRIIGVRPSDQQTSSGGLRANMVFRYRDAETMNLNGPNTRTPGTGSIPEASLIIFLSTNSGNTFGAIGRDGAVDQTNNTVSKTGVTNFATFTLGDQNNPLPVRLTAFDAKRFGKNALITWQTATEFNSKGYEVQASTNGTEFHTVAYVASAAPNSTKLTNYSYEDKTSYSAGTVYYRLHQIDLDGKEDYFGPRTVSFDGKATAASAVAYPNPYNANDELHIALESNDAGKGTLRITDMTGRTVREESIELNKGLSDMPVNGVKELKAGVYMVRVTLPSGETKTLKVVKQ